MPVADSGAADRAQWLVDQLEEIVEEAMDPMTCWHRLCLGLVSECIKDLALETSGGAAAEMRKIIRSKLRSGETYKSIGRMVGISAASVRRIMDRVRCRAEARYFFNADDHAPWCICIGLNPVTVKRVLVHLSIL